ncbi:hypothetical protein PZ61_0235625 [Streptomyces sp. MNU77]|uniref:NIPSNAP family protein n=1 Tax=Streptomyces sp. MNU77 TaxID=1573406 RepID=UPI0005E1B287|nr:NIPSNAP family protein [Streptomyces sp. MNU77]OLO25771.1 hypothetical protein PZ61_0235625 [Streptomyces sp. MNU77]
MTTTSGVELRIYRCPGPEQLRRLNIMLGEDGLPMFARHGIEVLDAWSVALGAATPVLAYLCPFPSLARRDAAWAAVDADDDWQKTKQRHAQGTGPLTSQLEFWWLTEATPLALPAGPGVAVDLLTSDGPLGGLAGQFDVVYGPAGRRLAFTAEGASVAAEAAGGRRVRMRRVAWSPAARPAG